jgi:hypothetical protein
VAIIFSFFHTEKGVPKPGLTPTVQVVRRSDKAVVVNGLAEEEIGIGWYEYIYAGASNADDYYAVSDGGISLPASERYVPCSSGIIGAIQDIQENVTFIRDIEGGRWMIDKTLKQMIFYKADNTTEVARFDLFDGDGVPAFDGVFERQTAGA